MIYIQNYAHIGLHPNLKCATPEGMKKTALLLACVALFAVPASTGALIGVPVMFPIQAQLEVGYAEGGIASPDVPVTVSVTLDMAFAPYKLTVDWGDGATSVLESSSMKLGRSSTSLTRGRSRSRFWSMTAPRVRAHLSERSS